MLAVWAPASRAAARMFSTSCAVSTGIIGAHMTRTGTPAWANARIMARRVAGAGARGSICRDRLGSSVVIDTPTKTCRRAAIAPIRSRSRRIVRPRVTMLTGWFQSCST